jgi:putative membrane protein
MRLRLTIGAAAAAATMAVTHPVAAQSTPAPGQTRSTAAERSGPESADVEFIRKASEGGVKEVEAGKLASEKAANAEVRAFAKQMVDDHSKSNAELMALVSLQSPTPAQKPSADTTLGGLTGAAFDRAYMAKMVTDHQATVELFEAEARDGKDDAVKKWAAQKLPTIRGHLEKARALQSKLGQTSSR